jgi:DNA-binding transcriptional ArsR family regulator
MEPEPDIETPDIESLARTIGDPTRIKMLTLLMEGRALTAKELAYGAGVEPATATAHLKRLLEERLVSVAVQGRHKYVRLASPDVAQLMELMMAVAPRANVRRPAPRVEEKLRHARMCYDHLAGELGIGITDGLVKQGLLRKEEDAFAVTRKGAAWFGELGIDLDKTRGQRRKFASQCLDWSERRDHLGGALGAALAERLIDLGWIARKRNSRAVVVTEAGRRKLAQHFALEP